MPQAELPGIFEALSRADAIWRDGFSQWNSSRGGTAASRHLRDLGDVLRDSTRGLAVAAMADVVLEGASAAMDVLLRHPVLVQPRRALMVADVFSRHPSAEAERWRANALDVLARGAIGLLLGHPDGDQPLEDMGIVDALMLTAFGMDPASMTLREIMLGKVRLDPSVPPAAPHRSLDPRLQELVVWGTIRDLLQAMRLAGHSARAYSNWAARATAHAEGITGLDPARGCAGTIVTIQGQGFGDQRAANIAVMFPTAHLGCREATVQKKADGSLDWTDTAIKVSAPEDVNVGCVGFLITDGPAPMDSVSIQAQLAAAAGMLQTVLGAAFGAAGVMFGQGVVDSVAAAGTVGRLPCPPCLPPDDAGVVPNRFLGGPPVIRSFTVNSVSAVQLHPGASITITWDVENADTITLLARAASWSRWPAELPQLPVAEPIPDKGTVGPLAVDYDGVDDWDGEYVISATNACADAPVTESVRIGMRERPPLLGIADTHAHLVPHLGFAGYGIWGRPHASDPAFMGAAGLADAVSDCTPQHGPGGALPSLEGVGGHLVGGYPEFDGWPRHSTLAHQQAYVDWIKRAVDGGLRLVVSHAVNNELVGKRMVELFGPKLAVDDTSAIARQLSAMRAMVAFVDAQGTGPGSGWMEIALTPADARRIVSGGRLAIVLGVEVDSLGGWATPEALQADAEAKNTTPSQLIANMVQDLYAQGVRHIFPVHGTNNAFGGPALFFRNYDATNFVVTGSSYTVEEAPQSLGISYRIDQDKFEGGDIAAILAYHGVAAAKSIAGSALAGLALGGLIGGVPFAIGGAVAGASVASAQYPCPPDPATLQQWADTGGGHINARGLTPHGEVLISELTKRGMLIDIDHMGHKTTERVLELCERIGYPVVSGHTGFRELKYGWRPSLPSDIAAAQYSPDTNGHDFGTFNARMLSREVDKTRTQLERIRRLGGLVAPITYHSDIRDCGCGFVANDSAGSSKSFAQALIWAHVHMHGRRVALGTDINGAARLPGPRFGPDASVGLRGEDDSKAHPQTRAEQVFSQRDGVRYSTPILDYRHHRFMDYADHPKESPFDAEQRDFWEAIAIWRSGTAPEHADHPPILQRTIATQNLIINLATGLRATSRSDLPFSITFPGSKPWPFYNVNEDEQLAAYIASHFESESLSPTDSERTRHLVAKFVPVWAHWQAMERGSLTQATDAWTQRNFGPAGSGLYDAIGNLTRSTAGRRDFDINLDGMAHYGMMPDLLQDLRNVGVPEEVIATLYRSAEDYIRVWERCEAKRP